MSKSKQDYPIVLKASHVAEVLDIIEPTIYKLMMENIFRTEKISFKDYAENCKIEDLSKDSRWDDHWCKG